MFRVTNISHEDYNLPLVGGVLGRVNAGEYVDVDLSPEEAAALPRWAFDVVEFVPEKTATTEKTAAEPTAGDAVKTEPAPTSPAEAAQPPAEAPAAPAAPVATPEAPAPSEPVSNVGQ